METVPLQVNSIIDICRELNANVPFPGISANAEEKLVKICLNGMMKCLQAHITLNANLRFTIKNPRGAAVVLQTFCRSMGQIMDWIWNTFLS